MATLKEDLRTFLLAHLETWPIFLDWMPEGEERAVLLVEYASGRPLIFGYGAWARRVQIIVMHGHAREAEGIAYMLFGLLNSKDEEPVELASGRRCVIRTLQLPVFLRREGAAFYGFNIVVHTDRR